MSINRAPFVALVDDDGSGTTGTPWNKQAIQNVLLDPIDVAIAAVPTPLLLLGSAAGSTSAAGTTENLDFQTVPVLTNKDSVLITVVAFNSGGTVPVGLDVLPVVNDVAGDPFLLTGTTGAGDLAPSYTVMVRAIVRPVPADNNGYIEWLASGAATVGTGQSRSGYTFAKLTVTSLALPAAVNRLYLRQAGVSAGGLLSWSWSVHLLKG